MITGYLTVEPEITWAEMRRSCYLSWDLHRVQGKNSSVGSLLELEVRDRLIEVEGAQAFEKYADRVHLSNPSSHHLTLTDVQYAVRQLTEYFAGHAFTGGFGYSVQENAGPTARLIVTPVGDEHRYTRLNRRNMWVPSDSSVERGFYEWMSEDVLKDRLKTAEDLLDHALGKLGVTALLHDHEGDGHRCFRPDCPAEISYLFLEERRAR